MASVWQQLPFLHRCQVLRTNPALFSALPHWIPTIRLRPVSFVLQRRDWVTEQRLDHLVNHRAALGLTQGCQLTNAPWGQHSTVAGCNLGPPLSSDSAVDPEDIVELLCAWVAFLKNEVVKSIKLGERSGPMVCKPAWATKLNYLKKQSNLPMCTCVCKRWSWIFDVLEQ